VQTEVGGKSIVPVVYHPFDSETGGEALGGVFYNYVQKTGQPLTILELWGRRTDPTGQARHAGFRRGLRDDPRITVVESVDTGWTDAGYANAVIDAFTAHPEYNGLFCPGGSQSGPIEALKTLGRLVPQGQSGHVVSAFIDCDFIANEYVDKGLVDSVSSHGPRDMLDTVTKMTLLMTVMGEPVPEEVPFPMVAITPDNIHTVTLMGGLAAWPLLGWDCDAIPFLDTSALGVPVRTLADRMEKLGY